MILNDILTKRSLIGGGLFLLYVGEVAVGAFNGLFTPQGFIVLALLYIFYFNLFDTIVAKYRLSNFGALLLNFALYSVLITGLLHGELADYVLHPENNLITTLIRLQCSIYPLFAYYWIRKRAPKRVKPSNIRKHLLIFLGFMLLISPTGAIGYGVMLETFATAPHAAVLFTALGSISLWKAFRYRATAKPTSSKWFALSAIGIGCIAVMPTLAAFIVLLVVMLIVGALWLRKPSFRRSAIS